MTPRKFDHAKTGYPLVGRHAALACASCHVQPATKVHLKFARCADCHKDPHRGVFKTQDCKACHKETGFVGGTFDHSKETRFPLEGKHAPLACASCHKGAALTPGVAPARRVVDFRGARPDCASCHADVHKGQLGRPVRDLPHDRRLQDDDLPAPPLPRVFRRTARAGRL